METLTDGKNAGASEQAVRLIGDLCRLAVRDGRAGEADRRIRDIRERHAPKRTFVKRLDAPAPR